MSYTTEDGDLLIRELSLRDRWALWGDGRGEDDRGALWPGLRHHALDRLQGRRSIVVAAFCREHQRPVSRVLFTRHTTDRHSWSYGYLCTLPGFRGRGIGTRLLRGGFDVIRRREARQYSCFVARDNAPSLAVNERLGFRTCGYSRVVLSVEELAAPSRHFSKLTGIDATMAGIVSELSRTAGQSVAGVVGEELCCARSLKSWAPVVCRHLVLKSGSGDTGGVGTVRPHRLTLVLWRETLSREDVAGIVTSLKPNQCARADVFAPERLADRLSDSTGRFTILVHELNGDLTS